MFYQGIGKHNKMTKRYLTSCRGNTLKSLSKHQPVWSFRRSSPLADHTCHRDFSLNPTWANPIMKKFVSLFEKVSGFFSGHFFFKIQTTTDKNVSVKYKRFGTSNVTVPVFGGPNQYSLSESMYLWNRMNLPIKNTCSRTHCWRLLLACFATSCINGLRSFRKRFWRLDQILCVVQKWRL